MEVFFVLLVVAAVLAVIPATIAASKGRDTFAWWMYGFFFFAIALVHSLLLRPDQATLDQRSIEMGNLKCQHCAEWIKREAKVCRYCGRDVEPPAITPHAVAPVVETY